MAELIRRWLARAELALILAAPFAYYQMPHEISSDGYFRLETTRYLARGQVIDQPFGLLMSVFALPLYHFGDVVALFNMITFFAGLAAIWLVLRRDVPAQLLRRTTLVLLAASMFPHHTQHFFGEVLTSMMVAIGIALMVTGHSWLGTAATLGVINSPATVPALGLMLLERARPPYRILKAAWPVAACALLLMVEYYLRRGNPFDSGYRGDFGEKTIMPYSGRPEFSYPFVFGVLSILFSFGKGLGIFMPGLWLLFKRPVMQVPRVLKQFQRHAGWFVIGLVLAYAKWWAWAGGWFWGPRFFLFASIPASVALAMHLSDEDASVSAKALTVALLAWSTWVGIEGAVYGQLEMSFCNAQPDFESLCLYTPEFSALFRPFLVAKALTLKEQIVFGYSFAAGAVLATPFVIDLLRTGRERLPVIVRRWLFASAA